LRKIHFLQEKNHHFSEIKLWERKKKTPFVSTSHFGDMGFSFLSNFQLKRFGKV
jgi:hypothetical protein